MFVTSMQTGCDPLLRFSVGVSGRISLNKHGHQDQSQKCCDARIHKSDSILKTITGEDISVEWAEMTECMWTMHTGYDTDHSGI